ncbi:MAG: pyridoxine 5'-phosphate synthase [Planctomycetaceae bacterium]|jgi:pyridoxine 5-phosphate synthase|nr:pyridoxine 5'-phosphate synthase [Planctomycetaceae bacterium]
MIELGVNIDHVATVRQARREMEPDPIWAAAMAEAGGADGITVHLREDRRHISDRDVALLRETVFTKLNLEMACVEEIVEIACKTVPDQATLVPERREEITTEGGLDVTGQKDSIRKIVRRLQDRNIVVSLFLDPDLKQIEAAIETGCNAIEIHTGCYASTRNEHDQNTELTRIRNAGKMIVDAGLRLHAGHGLAYNNVLPIAEIPNMRELNIGHSIICRAFLYGIPKAVEQMKRLIRSVSNN